MAPRSHGYGMNDDARHAYGETTARPPAPMVSFDGRRGALAGLLFRNLLLTLATVGIYRYWAKTRVRAFLWRHVKLLDEPLEYLGTGTELFIGFLVALVVLTPLTSGYSLLPYLLPDGIFRDWLDALYFVILLFLFQLAIYRVWRYRLTRTAWRGVRFGLDGSSFVYALIRFLYGFVTLATLGLAYPWLRVATTRYVASHARFGSTAVSFHGNARWLFPRWLTVIMPALAAPLLFVAVNVEAFKPFVDFWEAYPWDPDGDPISDSLVPLSWFDYRPLWLLLPSVVFRTWYRVSEFRYLLSGVRVGEVRLDSGLPAGKVYALQFVFLLVFGAMMMLLWMIGAAIIVGVLSADGGEPGPAAIVAMVLLAVAAYLLYGPARKLFLDIPMLKLACATLWLEQPEALERTVQSTAALPGHGEGLADALDMGGF